MPFIGIITYEVMRTAGIIRSKMDLVCQAQGKSKLGEGVGVPLKRGKGCSLGRSGLPLGVCRHEYEQKGSHALLSKRQMERAGGEWVQHGRECGNVLMGCEKQDSHWEIAFWMPGRHDVLGVAGCQPTGGSPSSLARNTPKC